MVAILGCAKHKLKKKRKNLFCWNCETQSTDKKEKIECAKKEIAEKGWKQNLDGTGCICCQVYSHQEMSFKEEIHRLFSRNISSLNNCFGYLKIQFTDPHQFFITVSVTFQILPKPSLFPVYLIITLD